MGMSVVASFVDPTEAKVAAGALCWLAALYLVRHPVRDEISGFLVHLLPARPAQAQPTPLP